MELKEFKPILDNYLKQFFDYRLKELQPVVGDKSLDSQLAYLKKFILAGGKRVRPYVVYLSFLSAGGKGLDDLLPVLAATELLHAFCLVHDDIMDQAETRHGIQSVHRYYEERLTKQGRTGDLVAVGTSQAILAGDLLLCWASELFYTSRTVLSNPEAILIRQQLLEAVILGQMIDVDMTTRHSVDMRLVTQKMYLKTATYSFAGPMKLGAALAGRLPDPDGWCEQVGLLLGLAYQLQDDLLDVTAQAVDHDKPILGDLQARQPTYFTQYVLDNGTADERKELNSYFGRTLTEKEQPAIVKLYEKSGALAAGQQLIDDYLVQARELIEEFPLDEAPRELWHRLINLIDKRRN
jgi:geranylgeranyl diphosphate synthase type I